MSAPGLLPAASEEEGSDGAESASAAGTADDVLAGCWSDAYEEVDGKSDAAELEDDSEPADSAADMPSSTLGFHMNAPTYACALVKSCRCDVSSHWHNTNPSANFTTELFKGQYRMDARDKGAGLLRSKWQCHATGMLG